MKNLLLTIFTFIATLTIAHDTSAQDFRSLQINANIPLGFHQDRAAEREAGGGFWMTHKDGTSIGHLVAWGARRTMPLEEYARFTRANLIEKKGWNPRPLKYVEKDNAWFFTFRDDDGRKTIFVFTRIIYRGWAFNLSHILTAPSSRAYYHHQDDFLDAALSTRVRLP